MKMSVKIFLVFFAISGLSCEKTKVPTLPSSAQDESTKFSSAATEKPADTVGAQVAEAVPATPPPTESPAKEEVVKPKVPLTGIALICSMPKSLEKVKAEVTAICVDGKASQALAAAVAAPYKGVDNPTAKIIKSTDTAGVSDIIVLSVVEVSNTAPNILAIHNQFLTGPLNSKKITATYQITDETPPTADRLLGYTLKINANLTLGALTLSHNLALAAESFALQADKTLIATTSIFDPTKNDSKTFILINDVAFLLQEAAVTKLITVNHQMLNNRGHADDGELAVVGQAEALMAKSYKKLTNN